jgi:hypothetical protein
LLLLNVKRRGERCAINMAPHEDSAPVLRRFGDHSPRERRRARHRQAAEETISFTEQGISDAVQAALDIRTVKSTIVPGPDLIDEVVSEPRR